MKKIVKITAIVLAFAMIACFAACGSKTDDSDSKETKELVKVVNIPLTDENYAFGVSKDDAKLQQQVNEFIKEVKEDGTLDKIVDKYFGEGEPTPVVSAKEDKSKDQLVVATNAAFAPFEYIEGDSYLGIDMELAKLLADKLGKELVIKNVDFDAVCANVDNGYADIAIAGLTVNESREKFVTFSDPYYKASQVVIAKADDTTFDSCKTAEDVEAILKGFDSTTKFGAQTGTTGFAYLQGDADFEFDGLKTTSTGYSAGALAVQDVINGNLDYVMIDQAPAEKIVESYNAQK